MASITALAASSPTRALEPNETLILQGGPGGDLYILWDGELQVERDGVPVTTISQRNALIGEMSILLGTPNTATVRAKGPATVRVVHKAREQLLQDPEFTFRLASLVARRLDATTALLVDLAKEHPGKVEQGLLARILSAIHLPAAGDEVHRNDLFSPASGLFADLPPGR